MYNILIVSDKNGEITKLVAILKELGCRVIRSTPRSTIGDIYIPLDAIIVDIGNEEEIHVIKEANKDALVWHFRDLGINDEIDRGVILALIESIELKRRANLLENMLGDAYKEIEKVNEYTVDSHMAVIYAMAEMAESRDKYAFGHLTRVQELCYIMFVNLIGTPYEYCMTSDNAYKLTQLSMLHDVGKVSIPDEILNKPSKLTTEEFEVMKTHVEIGEKIIKNIMNLTNGYRNEYLEAALGIVSNHHEKWDGTGYPRGKKGEEIPLLARIMAIVDVYDALRSERPYKKPMGNEESLQIILNDKGKHFDPILVDVFERINKEVEQIYLGYNPESVSI